MPRRRPATGRDMLAKGCGMLAGFFGAGPIVLGLLLLLRAPDWGYFLMVVGGLVCALAYVVVPKIASRR